MATPSTRSERRRAGMHLGLLDFLQGYPDDAVGADGVVPWVTLVRGHPPDRTAIDRRRITRATRTWTKLATEHRATLDALVPDAERWLARAADLLERLKPAVHRGAPLEAPPPPARVSPPADPRADALIDALRWRLALTPDAWPAALRCLAAAGPALVGRPRVEAVRLTLLGVARPDATRAWLDALAVPPAPERPAIEAHHAALVRACRLRASPPGPPVAPRPLVDALAARTQDELARVAPLLAALTPSLAAIAAAWATTIALRDEIAQRFALGARPTESQHTRAKQLAAGPIPGDGPGAIAAAFVIAREDPIAGPAAALLPRVPEDLRPGLVAHWAHLVTRLGAATAARAVEALARHVDASRSLAPWRDVGVESRFFKTPESVIGDCHDLPLPALDAYFAALTHRHGDAPHPFTVAELVVIDPALAPARVAALARLGGKADPPRARLELAHDLAGADVVAFTALIQELGWDDDQPLAAVNAALRTVPGLDRRGLVELVRVDRGRVHRLGRALRIGAALGLDPPSPAGIAGALPPPEPLPDPHAGLAAELAWLESRGGPPERAATLRRRLATPAEPSAAERARHARRQERRVAAAAMEHLRSELDRAIGDRLGALFGDRPIPAWLDDHRPIVAAVLALPSPYRELGRSLLVRRAGDPPWDPRDHPKNVAFLARVAPHLGSLAPWVEGARWSLPAGRVAALDPDPLAVLGMGDPFGTCLSPGATNFFSAVVNAADVNKRVLFVRDAGGRTLARCLLALTAHGGLVTHRVYDTTSEGLEGVVAARVRALAEDIGATLVPRGVIEPLLAPRWYDDGAQALPGDPLDGALERALAATPFVLDDVRALFGDAPEALWLPRVLAVEAAWRPEVREALRARVLVVDLADADRQAAATRFAHAGDHEAVTRLLGPAAVRIAQRQLDEGYLDAFVARVGAAVDPSGLLRVLRRRPDGHTHAWLLEARAACLAALHRPKQAEAARAAARRITSASQG